MSIALNRISLFLLVITILNSCSPLKFWEKAVSKHYGEFPSLKPVPPNTRLLVKLPLTEKDSSRAFVTGNRELKKNLFLLVYWKRHTAYNVRLNDKIPLHQFSNSLYQYAKSNKIMETLKGDQMIIEVNQWPNSFSYNLVETAYLMMIVFTRFYIEPKSENILVSYKIQRDGITIKEGKMEVTDPTRTIGVGMFQTVNAASDNYLTRYDAFYKGLGKQVIDKILAAQ